MESVLAGPCGSSFYLGWQVQKGFLCSGRSAYPKCKCCGIFWIQYRI